MSQLDKTRHALSREAQASMLAATFLEALPKARPSWLRTVGLLVGLALPAWAARAAEVRHLDTCASCHGQQGRSSAGEIPHLAGQQAAYLAKQLQAFKNGERKSELMQAVAAQLSPEDIQALARHWSSLPADGAPHQSPAGTQDPPSAMRFPASFPGDFIEYDRAVDGSSRVTTVRYANRIALEAARTGRPLPHGSVILSADYAAAPAPENAASATPGGRLGALLSLAGMQSGSGWGTQIPALLRNGDWHYGLWGGDGASQLRGRHAQCLACHLPRAPQSHLFTRQALERSAGRNP